MIARIDADAAARKVVGLSASFWAEKHSAHRRQTRLPAVSEKQGAALPSEVRAATHMMVTQGVELADST